MKKILSLLILSIVFSIATVYAQSAKDMLAEIEGTYTIDDNGNVTYIKIVEAPGMSKDEIFSRAQNYFIYNYGSGKSVIQTQDKEMGLLVGKGLYPKVHSATNATLLTTTLDAWHILRIDAQDGRARIIITLTQYEKTISGGNSADIHSTNEISSEYPINPKGKNKTIMTKAFYKSNMSALATLDRVEKAILEGSTSSSIENEDW